MKTSGLEGTFASISPFSYSQLPSIKDKEAFDKVKSTPPTAAAHPNLFAWFCLTSKFTDAVRNTWAQAAGVPQGGKQEKKKEAIPAQTKPVEKKVEEKPAEDEMDLFGDDDNEEDSVCFLYLIGAQ